MRNIYKKARKVVMWLGNAGEESDRAMDLIHALSNSCLAGEELIIGRKSHFIE